MLYWFERAVTQSFWIDSRLILQSFSYGLDEETVSDPVELEKLLQLGVAISNRSWDDSNSSCSKYGLGAELLREVDEILGYNVVC